MKKLERLFDLSLDMLCIAGLDGYFKHVNPAFTCILGYEKEELLARPFLDFVHPDDRDSTLEEVARLTRGEPVIDFENRYLCKDGTYRWLAWRGASEPAEETIYAVARDVTEHRRLLERQRLHDQMLHAQKLESLGVLAGGIAHDFNNILVGILGNSGLALEELPAGSPARPFIERVEQAAERAADLAGQMLAYSGKGHFVISNVDPRRLVKEMADLLETSISKKAELRFEFGDEVPAIRGDATQIRQVIMNLITNASDALGDGGGVIRVRLGAREVDAGDLADGRGGDPLPAGPYVVLEVSDSGCGMDAETRARIFDPFFTTKRAGRGLGMAAVLGIVRGHQGVIKVDSDPGGGSTFTVLFPASDEPADEVDDTEAATRRGHGKILIVDDEALVREVAEAALTKAGFEVMHAADGRQALAAVERRGAEIAAVVLDLTMPHMNGQETFQEVCRLRPDLPVILTSGYNEQDAIRRFTEPGPAGFLKKPYRTDDLLRIVGKVLGSEAE